jgi:hypothetical protein
MSLPVSDTLDILRAHLTDASLLQAIGKDLIKAEKEAKEAKVTEPRGKTRMIALLRSADPAVKLAAQAGVFLISVPDDDSTATYSGAALLSRLAKAAAEYNNAPKKRRAKTKVKADTWATLFRNVPTKTFKAVGSQISVKAKGNAHELIVLETEAIPAP